MSKPIIGYYEEGPEKNEISNLLQALKLYKLYDELERELNIALQLDSDNQQCSAELKGNPREVPKLLKLCNGICNIISKVRNIKGFCRGEYCSRSFIYMSIWLYEHVKQIDVSDPEINNFYAALKSFMKTKQSELKHCSIINFNNYKNEFMPMKYVCEFMHIYEDIKVKISENNNLNVKLYCKHIKYFFEYYNKIKKKCNNKPKPIFCTMIDKIKTTFTTTDYIKTIYDKCKYEATSCNNNIVATSDIPCLKDISIIPAGSGDKKYILKIINTASLSVIPVFVLLLILYKFTPLGVYIRSRIGRKKNIHNHVGQENYDLLKYTSNVEEISPDNRRYNVMYQ